MAEVYIAAAPGDGEKARVLAEALCRLGFDAEGGAPSETSFTAIAENAACVVALFSRASAHAPWLTALSAIALSRRSLVCASLDLGARPAPFAAAPLARGRAAFKLAFGTLIAAIDKLAPPQAPNPAALPEAMAHARIALFYTRAGKRSRTRQWGMLAASAAALFVVGFGAGRVMSAIRSGEMLVTAEAAATPTSAPLAAVAPGAAALPLSAAQLERRNWRTLAQEMNAEAAAEIQARAEAGEAEAQTLACLGHLAGAPGFLPSPNAARAQCDAAAARAYPPALYLSWALYRAAPHAGLSEADARGRLAQAARNGFSAAQIEYALSSSDQTEAGQFLLAAAEANDPRGQYEYARWLRDSEAGPRDVRAAIPFLERAAEAGQPEAQHMLATLHRDGMGVSRDLAKARALYQRAAGADYPPAMFNLADLMRGGAAEERAQAIALYQRLACMRDERQIAPLAQRRLRALSAAASC
ncbi:MAG: hypothetical protein NVV62_07295 [Terricaulis sp.]|nr:hypothetical protein [Terricaulis sp.]